jgi:hypothetical protein
MKILLSLFILISLTPTSPIKEDWKNLFNGKDLSGWDTYLGIPGPTVDYPAMTKNAEGLYTEKIGLNKDGGRVFSVEMMDAKPAIKISGEIWGGIVTKEEFENYHLSIQFKWGEKKWAPREGAIRDSGILYHSVGDFLYSNAWMKSQECQVQEGDCGDFWAVGPAMANIASSPQEIDGKPVYVFDPQSPNITFGNGEGMLPYCKKSMTNEKPLNEWNTIEIICFEEKSIHIVNGKVNMILKSSRHISNGRQQPLNKGKIQLQSEGAEVFYRDIMIKPIKRIPKEFESLF